MNFINSRLETSHITRHSDDKFTFTMDDPIERNKMMDIFSDNSQYKDQAESIRYQYLPIHWTPTVIEDEDVDGEVHYVVTVERTAIDTITTSTTSPTTNVTRVDHNTDDSENQQQASPPSQTTIDPKRTGDSPQQDSSAKSDKDKSGETTNPNSPDRASRYPARKRRSPAKGKEDT